MKKNLFLHTPPFLLEVALPLVAGLLACSSSNPSNPSTNPSAMAGASGSWAETTGAGGSSGSTTAPAGGSSNSGGSSPADGQAGSTGSSPNAGGASNAGGAANNAGMSGVGGSTDVQALCIAKTKGNACGTCLCTMCTDKIAACYADTSCATLLECVNANCSNSGMSAAGGMSAEECFIHTCDAFSNNIMTLTEAQDVQTCGTAQCAAACSKK